MKIYADKAKPDRALYWTLGLYELKDEHWIPVPVIIIDEDKEFLVFNTSDFFADTKALYKIRKITGMRLVQMSTHDGHTQLWFYRPLHINK